MVERTIDKKIRILQELLDTPTDERMDSERKPHPCKYFNTDTIKSPYKLVIGFFNELKLTISSENNLGEIFGDGETDDHLLEVIIEEDDAKRLSNLLKEYQTKFPKRKKPLIREKTLELISQKIGNIDTGNNLVKFLRNCGVDEELIIYPNTKWRMIFDALVYLSCSYKKEDKDALSKVIGEATHPLMHGGDTKTANALREEFSNYLHYDNLGIAYDKDEGTYWALRNADDDEAAFQAQIEEDDEIRHYEERSEKQLAFLSKPENKEKISLLRKAYQQLMNVIFFFCEDPTHPTVELNQNFQYLYKLINTTINELGLWRIEKTPFSRNEHFFYLPFSNLFSAEKVYEEQGKELSWQQIRPEMNAMYGDIEEIYQEVSGSDVLAEPDKQKKLNEIQLALSVLKKKRGMAKKMPELKVKRLSGSISQKLHKSGFEKKPVNSYQISVKDREVWINKCLIGKPYAVGSNFEFFEYVRSEPANTPIERDKMPKWGDGVGYAFVKDGVKNKSFIKILNELGFKGEILKAFFYKRSKNSLTYRGDKITKKDLEKAGIKKSLFLKELELAHARNSPE